MGKPDNNTDRLIQALGDLCHEKYMGCVKSRNTGNTNHDYDYCYTDELVNMLDTPEARALFQEHSTARVVEELRAVYQYRYVDEFPTLKTNIVTTLQDLDDHISELESNTEEREL